MSAFRRMGFGASLGAAQVKVKEGGTREGGCGAWQRKTCGKLHQKSEALPTFDVVIVGLHPQERRAMLPRQSDGFVHDGLAVAQPSEATDDGHPRELPFAGRPGRETGGSDGLVVAGEGEQVQAIGVKCVTLHRSGQAEFGSKYGLPYEVAKGLCGSDLCAG